MSRRLPLFPFSALALFALSAFAAPSRRTIVMAVGEQTVLTTVSQVATVSMPPGTPAVVTFVPEQYGNSIALTARKKGEAKLLIESTQSRISEIVNVIVADKAVAARYRFATGSMAGIEGLTPADITVTDKAVVIGGTLFSLRDLQRCRSIDTSSAKASGKAVPTFCVARLSSALPAVTPDAPYEPASSVTFSETADAAAAGAIEGSEGMSGWSAVIRIGDIPVMELDSRNRADLMLRAAGLASRLNTIAASWRLSAQTRAPYPVAFSYHGTAAGYDLGAEWKFDQGTRGETLIRLTPDDLQNAAMRSGGGVERMIQWWAALMQDAFRMYYMAALPSRSPAGASPILKDTYLRAVSLSGGALTTTNAPSAVARAVAAKRWSGGTDPFAAVLTTIPPEFQPAPVAR